MTMENGLQTADQPPVTPPPADIAPPSPPPRRGKGKLILKIIAGLVVLLILLVLIAPTLISSGPVMSIILGQVNKHLNGKVAVESMSLGWFSGAEVKGVRVFDAGNAQIAGLEHASIPLPLWKAAIGNYALGNVVIEGVTFDERIDSEGVSNFQKLVKASPTPTASTTPPTATESGPSKLPNISGDIKLSNCRGTITQAGKPTVFLSKLDGEAKIPDINQPIADTLNAIVKVGDEPEGTVSLAGTAAVVKSNLVAIDTADVHQTLDATGLPLATAKPFLPANLLNTLDGVIAAHMAIDLTGGKTLMLDASIDGKQKIAIGGPVLKGDSFSTTILTASVPKLTGEFPDGVANWKTGHIKVGAGAGPILFKIDQGQLTMSIDAQVSALLNVIANAKPGSAGSLSLNDHFDLAAFARELPHLLNVTQGVTVTSGTLAQDVKASWTADQSTLAATSDITDVRGTRATGTATTPITLAPIHVAVDATDLGRMDFRNMKLSLASKFATADFQGTTLANLTGKLHADLKAMQDELGQLVDLSNAGLNGTVDADLSETGELTAAPYQSKLTMSVSGKDLRAGVNVNLPVLQVAMNADLHGSKDAILNSIQNLLLTVKTGDGKTAPEDVLVAKANANLDPTAKSPLDLVISAHAQIDVPEIKRVMTLAGDFSPQIPAIAADWTFHRDTGLRPVRAMPKFQKTRLLKFARNTHGPEARFTVKTIADSGTTPASDAADKPAMEWDSGSLSSTIDISHDPKGMKSQINLDGKNLAFHTGDVAYRFKPISVKLGAVLASGDTPAVPIGKLVVTDLTGDLGIATLSMPSPIVVTPMFVNPQANGGVKITGAVADLAQFLAAMQGQKPAAYPYRGEYTVTENVASRGSTIALKGGINIAKFQAYNGNTITFSEDMLSIANDISYVITTAGIGTDANLNINTLSASMKSSGALNLTIAGGSIRNLDSERDLNLQPKLDYDLAKLWPIVQPMMGDSYKTLKISGHYQKQFNVTGSYPANEPSTVAIQSVKANGELAVESFDYDGLTIKNLVVPFLLGNGKVMTVYGDKPAGQNLAAPAIANDTGALDVGGLLIDLTQSPPRLTTPANKAVISKLTINPLLAGTYLKNIINNPLFTGTESATGLVDLTIADCNELPLGNLVTLPSPENKGKIDLLVSITKLNIGVGNAALAKALGNGSFQADVKNGTISIARGISTQHIKFVTGSYTLAFDGSVRLKDEAFIPMTMSFPLKAIAEKTHFINDPKVVAMLPDVFPVIIEGTVDHPAYRFDKMTKAVADATIKAAAGNLFGGNKKDGNNNSKENNPLNGLLNGLKKKL